MNVFMDLSSLGHSEVLKFIFSLMRSYVTLNEKVATTQI